jgi:hypothetical protein
MSAPVARRRCPSLRVVAAPAHDGIARAHALLEEIGEVSHVAGALCVTLDAGELGATAALARATAVARRLWQGTALEAVVVVAARADDAATLAGLLDAGQVAAVPRGAAGAWASRPSARITATTWRGDAPDLEGAVASAVGLGRGAAAGIALTFTALGLEGAPARAWSVTLPHGAGVAVREALVEGAARRALRLAGGVRELRVRAAPVVRAAA